MNVLYQSAFAGALGWSLIDSLWQMGSIWLIYVLISANGTRYNAAKRHTLAMLGFSTGTIIFLASFLLNYLAAVRHDEYYSLAYFIGQHSLTFFSVQTVTENLVPIISLIYLPVVSFFAIRLFLQMISSRNIYQNSLVEAEPQMLGFVQEMCKCLGINKHVSLWLSHKAESPLTIGSFKPLILLPVAVFTQLSCRQVEAVIAHEIFHVKRNDYLINIFLSVSAAILFFNPFAKLMLGIIRKERENSCDDYVMACGYGAWEYAEALYLLGRNSSDHPVIALAATGAGKEFLLQRIRRIMKKRTASPSLVKPLATFFLCLFVAGSVVRQASNSVTSTAPPPPTVVAAINNVQEEKTYVDIPAAPTKLSNSKMAVKTTKKASTQVNSAIPEPPVETPPPPPSILIDEEADDVVISYVAEPGLVEFTYIDREEIEVPEIVRESSQPFVQKSSFYYCEIDTTVGRSVIKL